MTPLFKKLNFKQQKEILILNYPTEFEEEVNAMKDFTTIKSNIRNISEIEFILTFVKTKTEIDMITPLLRKKLKGDSIVWFAYPKGASKKYKVEINRDTGWEILRKSEFEAVRQISIDEDWSALRFRKIEFIKAMRRSSDFAMTEEEKVKTNNNASCK